MKDKYYCLSLIILSIAIILSSIEINILEKKVTDAQIDANNNTITLSHCAFLWRKL